MTIFGIGTDVVEVERIAGAIDRFGEMFLARLFTAAERGYCGGQKRPEVHYAARFAAKEAVAKALGTGIGRNLEWLDMEVARNEDGRPALVLGGAGLRFAESHGIREVMISMSHTRTCAVAQALAVGR